MDSTLYRFVAGSEGKIGGRVWFDENTDELHPDNGGCDDLGDEGIAFSTVQLVRDANGDGKIGRNEVLAAALTDSDGYYSFEGLTAGQDYQLRFDSPDRVGLSEIDVFEAWEGGARINAGYYDNSELGGVVWEDANADGVRGLAEGGISGIRVELYSAIWPDSGDGGQGPNAESMPSQLLAYQLTDSNGAYNFSDLFPTAYFLRFIAPDGRVLTVANGGQNDSIDSDADQVSGFVRVDQLHSGQYAGFDAGLTGSPLVEKPMDGVEGGIFATALPPLSDMLEEDRLVGVSMSADSSQGDMAAPTNQPTELVDAQASQLIAKMIALTEMVAVA